MITLRKHTLTSSWYDFSNFGESLIECEGESCIMQELCQVCHNRLSVTAVEVQFSFHRNGAIPERAHMQ